MPRSFGSGTTLFAVGLAVTLCLALADTSGGLGVGAPAQAAARGTIVVVSATYGRSCRKPTGNVTAHLARSCNGRASCAYRVNHGVIGDPAPGCAKDYVAVWRCAGERENRTAALPREASGRTLALACRGGSAASAWAARAAALAAARRRAAAQGWAAARAAAQRRAAAQAAARAGGKHGGINLARGRPATQSSTGWGGSASRAVDGNTSGLYNKGSVTHTNNANPWWQVDLGRVVPIQKVVVHNRTDCCSERLNGFVVQVANDCRGRFRTVGRYGRASRTPMTVNVRAHGRCVRIALPGGRYLSLAEVEVFGSPSATAAAGAQKGIRGLIGAAKKKYWNLIGKARAKIPGLLGKVTSRLPAHIKNRLPAAIKSRLPGARPQPAAAASSGKDICWKHSYGRGVGVIPSVCGPGETKSGLLCYQNCKPGYKVVAGVCWEGCPRGYRDTGGHCLKPSAYGRGGGYVIWDGGKCNRAHRATGGCEKWGAMWYPKCRRGFHAFGCCVCTPNCPAGMLDIGVSCQKRSYVVPPRPARCRPDQVYDAGLCYTRCKKGYHGVGPVCWGGCNRDYPSDCGAACAVNKKSCAVGILKMIAAPLQVVANVVSFVGTGGAAAAGKIGAQAAIAAAKAVGKALLKKAAKKLASSVVKKVAGHLVARQQSNPKFDAVQFLKDLDPTGIAEVVDAFKKPICKVP